MTTNHAEKRLAKNTIIYMIGNISSKFLQMLILPIITSILLTEEYGYYDLVVTTISLVQPVITLQLIEAMFRFLFNRTDNEKRITISTVVFFLIIGSLLLGLVISGIYYVSDTIQYPVLIYLNYVSCIIFTLMQKMSRCEKKNIEVAASGVINTFVMLFVQCITLVVFKLRVDGLLLANCISYIVAALYLNSTLHIERKISYKNIDLGHAKELLAYSLPLIPNSVSWWFVAACDKYIITIFLTVGSNGIYSIASKFSQLLTLVTNVFQMAWQESAIMELDSDRRDQFYSNTFNIYMKLLLSGYLLLLPLIRIIIPFLVSKEYQIGYLYNPILLIGAIFSAFSQFYGSSYLTFKKTNGAFTTTIIAAVVNCGIALLLIKPFGLFAPAIGTSCAFFVQWMLRAIQMRSYFKIKIDLFAFIVLLCLCVVFTFVYYVSNQFVHYISFIISSGIFVFFNRKLIMPILRKFIKK